MGEGPGPGQGACRPVLASLLCCSLRLWSSGEGALDGALLSWKPPALLLLYSSLTPWSLERTPFPLPRPSMPICVSPKRHVSSWDCAQMCQVGLCQHSGGRVWVCVSSPSPIWLRIKCGAGTNGHHWGQSSPAQGRCTGAECLQAQRGPAPPSLASSLWRETRGCWGRTGGSQFPSMPSIPQTYLRTFLLEGT